VRRRNARSEIAAKLSMRAERDDRFLMVPIPPARGVSALMCELADGYCL